METKHTPGPWNISQNPSEKFIKGSDRLSVCDYRLDAYKAATRLSLYSGDKQTEQDLKNYLKAAKEIDDLEIANAKLIAAAPELLEALFTIVTLGDNYSFYKQVNSICNAAIKKATS